MRKTNINGKEFYHGQLITCYIQDEYTEDAAISINTNGEVYVCQNVRDGADANDKFSYKYSWYLDDSVSGITARDRDYQIF